MKIFGPEISIECPPDEPQCRLKKANVNIAETVDHLRPILICTEAKRGD